MNLGDLTSNMGSLPKLKEIWDNLQERNWGGLISAIQSHKGDDNGSHDELLGQAESAATDAQSKDKPFPDSPQDFLKLLQR